MVLIYAVPIALFVGTVGTSRADLVKDITFAVAIFVAIVGMYALAFLLFRLIFRFSPSESVLAALAASAPAAPFMGPTILGDLFGKASAVSIAIAALVINLVVVPLTILGLALGRASLAWTPTTTTRYSGFAKRLLETVKRADRMGARTRFRACAVRRQHPSTFRPRTFIFRAGVEWRRTDSPRASCLPPTKLKSIGVSYRWRC
jgi:hypothetical protein